MAKNWIKRHWGITVFSLITLVLIGIYIYHIFQSWLNEPGKAGQFGDMFGAVTALVGSITFILLIYSIRLQTEELEVARQDYRLALTEMKAQTDINKKIQQTARLQRIENTFFKMLELFIKSRTTQLEIDDLKIFPVLLGKVNQKFYLNPPFKSVINYTSENHQFFVNKYSQLSGRWESRFDEYYIHINNIFSLLADSKLSLERTKFYLRIFRAYIQSDEEMILQFYYLGLSINVDEHTKEFARKSDFFKDVNKKLFPLVDTTYYRIMYPSYSPFDPNSIPS